MTSGISHNRLNKLDDGGIDWPTVTSGLDSRGCAVLPALVSPAACRELAGLYGEDSRFRSRVIMSRHGFGQGEYRYFAYPLPPLVAHLRASLYPHLAPIANEWSQRLGDDQIGRASCRERV